MKPRIQLAQVSHRYHERRVIRDITLDIFPGERILLAGSNGSGKSTLLKIAAGLITPWKGTCRFGRAPKAQRPFSGFGYLGHELLLYRGLTVHQNLGLFSKLKRSPLDLEQVLQQWDLSDKKHRILNELSRGERARVALARSFLGSPRVLLLDEPTAHLDTDGVALLRSHLAQISEDTVVVLSTHEHDLFRSFSNRVIILHKGELQFREREDQLATKRMFDVCATRRNLQTGGQEINQ
ncbi:MAG: ABC transporter ATP-binding protein [Bdellovibrionales bacterium]|nr:ABC transporter ATP-binding protein [Bdellovibrionales bacterium]